MHPLENIGNQTGELWSCNSTEYAPDKKCISDL